MFGGLHGRCFGRRLQRFNEVGFGPVDGLEAADRPQPIGGPSSGRVLHADASMTLATHVARQLTLRNAGAEVKLTGAKAVATARADHLNPITWTDGSGHLEAPRDTCVTHVLSRCGLPCGASCTF